MHTWSLCSVVMDTSQLEEDSRLVLFDDLLVKNTVVSGSGSVSDSWEKS